LSLPPTAQSAEQRYILGAARREGEEGKEEGEEERKRKKKGGKKRKREGISPSIILYKLTSHLLPLGLSEYHHYLRSAVLATRKKRGDRHPGIHR
jgi:hypothetical protein